MHDKSTRALRIFFQNINGLTFTQNGEDYDYVHGTLDTMKADMVGLSETNSPWNNHLLTDGYRRAANRYAGISKTHFSSANDLIDPIDSSTLQQSGGTVSTVNGGWTTSVRKSIIKDPTGLGRWSGVIIGGKQDKRLAIITGYRVCEQSRTSAGENTSYAREWEYFRDQGIDKPNPRQQFLTDMTTQISSIKEKHDVILMFDANENIESQSISAFMTTCGLHDLHATSPATTTCHSSSAGRIDYMLGTTAVVSATIQGGTLSYAEGLTSDHRGLFVDIDYPELLKLDTVNEIIPSAGRILRSGNPEMQDKYNEQVKEYFNKHNVFKRLDRIITAGKRYSKSRIRSELNSIDDDMGRAMSAGENSLRTPLQKYQFSPTLRKCGLLQQYWRQRFQDHFQDQINERPYQTIEDEMHRYEQDYQLPYRHEELSIETIRKEFTSATTALRNAQKNAGPLRYQFQAELMERYRVEGDLERMRVVERNIKAEHVRAMFRKIGSDMKPQQRTSINQILTPHHPDQAMDALLTPHEVIDLVQADSVVWEHVFEQMTIEEVLLAYNRQSFRQAADSPLGSGMIYDSLKFSSLSTAGSEILAGQIPDTWSIKDPTLTALLSSFAIPDAVKSAPPIQTSISEDDFVYGINGWKESTSTSPSGRHLGHYKALINDPDLLTFYVQFLNVLVSNGLSLDRWQNAINVLIEKDPGEPKLNRLRIIHLFEADYNFILKLLWGSRLVKNGEELQQLNNNQHGSRRGRQSLDPVHLQLISMDLCRILKLNMASFDNDASACYDRIIVALGMLAARRLGMPDNAVRCHSQALQMMKYTIKTIYGISENNYHGTPFEPLFGTGQGSGASPAVWLTLVVILLDTLDKLIDSRMTFTSPDLKQLHQRLADAFVDDTSMGFTDPGQLSYPAMISELQHIAQTWEKLLHYSGGALNLKKCHWWMMYWEWKDGRPTLRPHTKDDPSVYLSKGRDKTLHTIKHSATTKANRILGVFLAPNGDFTTQLEILRDKAQKYSARLRKSRLTAGEAYTFYRTTYIPAMTYTLPALACNEEELQQVQSAVLPALLNQLGVHSKFPTALRHGPNQYAGLDIADLRTESGIYLLKALRDSVFASNDHGQMMITSIKTSQLESGISNDLLLHPSIAISYLTPTWITTIRQYLYNHGMSVDLTDTLDMTPSCKFDQLLMDPARLQQYTPDEQLDINLVRINLQAVYISDLATGDGLALRRNSINGQTDSARTSTYIWPRQPVTTKKQRNRWTRYMKEQFLLSDGKRLKTPIGEWIHTTRNVWRFTTDSNYLYDHQTQRTATLKSQHRRHSFYNQWTTNNYKPFNSEQTPTTLDSPAPFLLRALHRQRIPTPTPATRDIDHTTLRNYLNSLPATQRRLLNTYHQTADDLTVWKALRSRQTLTIASDGGLKTDKGTYGWKIVTNTDEVLFSGAGPVDGDYRSASSTRSELYGIAAPVLLLASLKRFWGTPHRAHYSWVCDSQSALKQVRQLQFHKTRKRRQPNNVDILSIISANLSDIGRKLEGKWVKAHQDDDNPYDELTRDARLNVDADKLATWYRDHATLPQTRQTTSHAPGTNISISIGIIRLTGNFDSSIRHHINGYQARQYIKRTRDWNDEVFDSVDWHNFGQQFKSLPITAQVQRTKLIHRWQPVGTQRLRDAIIKDPALALCPTCRTEIETPDHLFLCDQRQSLRHRHYLPVQKVTSRKPYHPAMAILSKGIQQWLSSVPITIQEDVMALPQTLQPTVSRAIYEQFDIGWNNALRGILSNQWAQAASIHHTSGHYELDTGNGHVYRTIRALHQFSSEIWEARNKQLHKRDDEEAARIRTPIDAVIKHLYFQPHLLHSTDRFRCDKPLADIIKLRPANKQRWVRRVKKAQERYAEFNTRKQLPLSQYPGYTYTARRRLILPAKPTPIVMYQQRLLSDILPQRPPQRRTAMPIAPAIQPRRRQTTITTQPATH